MKVSNLTKLSVVLQSDLKPDWNLDILLLDSKNQVSLLFIILSSFYIDNLLKFYFKATLDMVIYIYIYRSAVTTIPIYIKTFQIKCILPFFFKMAFNLL